MKSERRHALATNELADWMSHMPQWWSKNGRNVVYGAVFAVAMVIAIWMFVSRKAAEAVRHSADVTNAVLSMERSKMQLANANPETSAEAYNKLVTDSEKFSELASRVSNQNLSALALIKQSQAIRAAAFHTAATSGEENLQRDLTPALAICQKAINQVQNDTNLLASAMIELGLVQEALGQLDAATQTYQKIISELTGTAAVVAAQARLAAL